MAMITLREAKKKTGQIGSVGTRYSKSIPPENPYMDEPDPEDIDHPDKRPMILSKEWTPDEDESYYIAQKSGMINPNDKKRRRQEI